MRTVLTHARARALAVIGCLLALSLTGLAVSKGPDAGGYTATDETAYSLIDASQGGAGVLAGADDGTAALTLPFPFEFYGQSYARACVSSNGALYFIVEFSECGAIPDFASDDLANTPPPEDRPGLFPFWTDLTFDRPGAGSVVYKTDGALGERQFVVEWHNAFPIGGAAPITFELILFEGSNQILFQYQSLGAAGNGLNAAVGIRAAGALANGKQLPWSWNVPVIADHSAIRFVGNRATPGISLTGGTFTYNAAPREGSGFAYGAGGVGDVLTPPLTFSYVGTGSTTYGPTTVAPAGVGAYEVTATFIGNAGYGPANATGTLAITPATLTYVATAASRAYGIANPPLTGTVSGFAGSETQTSATTGTLLFASAATSTSNVGSYAIDGSGLAAINGNYTFTQAAGNASALTIVAAAQTITFTSVPPAAPAVGDPAYTLTATGGASGNPVTFTSLTSGTCSVTGAIVNFITAGACQVAADQAGNSNYNAAAQATQAMIVAGGGAAPTTTTLTSAPAPSAIGQNVVFTATVKRTSNDSAVTIGTVTFKEGDATLAGPTALNGSGQASFSTASLTAGPHTIAAFYNGAAGAAASTGSSLHTVNLLATEASLYSIDTSSEFSDSVTFTAWIHRGLFPVGTGTVTFKDGAVVLAANVPLNSVGLAFITTSTLSVASHAISVTFNGTPVYAASTDTVTQTVAKASTSTSLVSSLNPSRRSQNVTFTVTVTHDGKAVTAGTVTFKDGATVLAGPVAVNGSGKASFSKSDLTQGDHTIQAVYSGTANYDASSDALTQTVRR